MTGQKSSSGLLWYNLSACKHQPGWARGVYAERWAATPSRSTSASVKRGSAERQAKRISASLRARAPRLLTRSGTYTHKHIAGRARTHTHTQSHTHTHTHTSPGASARTHTLSHTHTHIAGRARTHSDTHTHTHT